METHSNETFQLNYTITVKCNTTDTFHLNTFQNVLVIVFVINNYSYCLCT